MPSRTMLPGKVVGEGELIQIQHISTDVEGERVGGPKKRHLFKLATILECRAVWVLHNGQWSEAEVKKKGTIVNHRTSFATYRIQTVDNPPEIIDNVHSDEIASVQNTVLYKAQLFVRREIKEMQRRKSNGPRPRKTDLHRNPVPVSGEGEG